MSLSLHPRVFSPFQPAAVALPRFGNQASGPNVLLVNDDPTTLRLYSRAIPVASPSAKVTGVNSYDAALAAFQAASPKPDFVVLDFGLGDQSRTGADLAKAFIDLDYAPERIIFLSMTDADKIKKALEAAGVPAVIIETPQPLSQAEVGKVRILKKENYGYRDFQACLSPQAAAA